MVGSTGLFVSSSSASSIKHLSQFLKNPIFFQDGVFFLFFSSLAIDHISLSRLLTMASSISLSCLHWCFKYSLYASSISSCDICTSPSSKSASAISGVDSRSCSWGLLPSVFSSGGRGMPSPFMAFSADSNQSPSALGLFVFRCALAGTWLDWRGTSDLYLSLLFGFSSVGVIVALFAFLFAERPVFCGFLGSAILAGGFDGGVGFSYGVWGFVRPLDVFPPTSRWCHMCARWCTSREGARLAKKQVHMGAQKLENGKMGVVGT